MAAEKCTRLPALTVERNVKFHSNLTAAGQCIVENATANEDHHEDIKLTYYFRDIIFFLFLALRKQIKRKKKNEVRKFRAHFSAFWLFGAEEHSCKYGLRISLLFSNKF